MRPRQPASVRVPQRKYSRSSSRARPTSPASRGHDEARRADVGRTGMPRALLGPCPRRTRTGGLRGDAPCSLSGNTRTSRPAAAARSQAAPALSRSKTTPTKGAPRTNSWKVQPAAARAATGAPSRRAGRLPGGSPRGAGGGRRHRCQAPPSPPRSAGGEDHCRRGLSCAAGGLTSNRVSRPCAARVVQRDPDRAVHGVDGPLDLDIGSPATACPRAARGSGGGSRPGWTARTRRSCSGSSLGPGPEWRPE